MTCSQHDAVLGLLLGIALFTVPALIFIYVRIEHGIAAIEKKLTGDSTHD